MSLQRRRISVLSALVPLWATGLVVGPAAGQQAPTPWQQGVSYRIEASLDEGTDVLSARARVWYRNESPDTLREFYLHLYLNAFRPNSAWARADLHRGIRTFQDLGPGEHAFERIVAMTVDGEPVALSYPHAPDSTIVRLELPRPLPPGGEITLAYDWRARLSTVPRRQGRAGRHYDFAQWYPRVVVYDLEGWRAHPLYRQGEFYGEFATYDVTMDLARDQVVAATGVPVEGDPGWEAAAAPGSGPVDHQRAWYGSMEGPPCVVSGGRRVCGITPRRMLGPGEPLGHLAEVAEPGRKRVRWRAEDVHHFAWSTDPEYIYERGFLGYFPIRVLYRPGDEEEWGGGVAVRRTAVALEWLDGLFGEYPYPQVSNVHRLEGGGTEFPMLIMDGGASQSLILHEVGHIYAHGILANNEWYEGWLDEGLSSFQTDWFFEERGRGRAQWLGDEVRVLDRELRGIAEPVVLQAEHYAEYGTYSTAIYTKGSLVFWMLREMVGRDTMREVLRTYYDRYRFRHVDQHAFQSVAEEVSGRDLDWFFGQWLHTNGVTDYALADVSVDADGQGYRTTVTVERRGEMRMPVPLFLEGGEELRDTVLHGGAKRATHVIRTPFRPEVVRLDPLRTTLDWNVLDDVWSAGLFGASAYQAGLDNPLRGLPSYREAVPIRFFPLAWLNDTGGVVGGLQLRTSYMGNMRRGLLRLGLPGVEALDRGGGAQSTDWGSVYARMENPLLAGRPRFGTVGEAFAGEGRVLLRGSAERDVSALPLSGPRRFVRVGATASWLYDAGYLVPGRWSPEERRGVEAEVGYREVRGEGNAAWSWDVSASAGLDTGGRTFVRAALGVEADLDLSGGWALGLQGLVGGVLGKRDAGWNGRHAPRERHFFLAGGDPYRALSNPWVRSRGALLDLEGRVDGGAGLLGHHPGIALSQLVAVRGDVSTRAATADLGVARLEARAHLFGAAAVGAVPTMAGGPAVLTDIPEPEAWGHVFGSAGAGVEVGLVDSPVRVRLDVPFYVKDAELATRNRGSSVAFRFAVGVTGY